MVDSPKAVHIARMCSHGVSVMASTDCLTVLHICFAAAQGGRRTCRRAHERTRAEMLKILKGLASDSGLCCPGMF